jgi:hypothetical protein
VAGDESPADFRLGGMDAPHVHDFAQQPVIRRRASLIEGKGLDDASHRLTELRVEGFDLRRVTDEIR